MSNYRRSVPLPLLAGSFVFAFILMILPVPELLRLLRPNFIILLLVFWLMRIPESMGVGAAWIIGFIFDAISGSYLGQHALSFSFIAYLTLLLYQQIRMFGVMQQALLIFILLILDQIIDGWISVVIRGSNHSLYYSINAVMGAFCWPLMSVWLNRYQRQFGF